ncbi:MAG: sulfatase [Phycisphaerales bacterium]|nr:sulfatase [Phycisphaerales bacterium]
MFSRSAIAACLVSVLIQSANASDPRPNIVFIFSDDHAAHAIGAYGGLLASVNPTPNIDKLGQQGMLFSNCFCANSICGPSRASIITGKHAHANGFGQNENQFDQGQPTFPKMLQKAGYTTAMIGKWHLGSDPQGFDYWKILPGQGVYYNPDFVSPSGEERIEGHCTELITDMALEWLKNGRDKSKPFLLMCQHKAPHRNWMPQLKYLSLYNDTRIPEPDTLFDDYADNAIPARIQEMEIDRHMTLVYDLFALPPDQDPTPNLATDKSGVANLERMTPVQRKAWDDGFAKDNAAFAVAQLTGMDLVRWKYQRYMKNYLRCVRGVDDCVGELMKAIDEEGLADNTVVIYSSDQGFYLGDYGWYDKRWMYDVSMRMPLIVKWPGVTKPGSTCDLLTQNIDFAETFLDIAGLKPNADMQGVSLVPLLKGQKPADWRDALYYHYLEFPSVHMVARHYGIRTNRYKLIHFYEFGEWEFYDLQRDPEERLNQYNNPDYADTITGLKGRLEDLRKVYKDASDVSEKPADWQARYRAADKKP